MFKKLKEKIEKYLEDKPIKVKIEITPNLDTWRYILKLSPIEILDEDFDINDFNFLIYEIQEIIKQDFDVYKTEFFYDHEEVIVFIEFDRKVTIEEVIELKDAKVFLREKNGVIKDWWVIFKDKDGKERILKRD